MNKKSYKKPIIIGTISLVLFVAAGVAVFTYRDALFGALVPQITDRDGRKELGTEALQQATTNAQSLIARGDTANAVQVLDDAIVRTDIPQEKAQLYAQKAGITVANDLPAAVDAQEEAATLDPTFENLAVLADLYEQNGDKEQAAAAYERALEVYDSFEFAEDGRQVDRTYYTDKIEELRS